MSAKKSIAQSSSFFNTKSQGAMKSTVKNLDVWYESKKPYSKNVLNAALVLTECETLSPSEFSFLDETVVEITFPDYTNIEVLLSKFSTIAHLSSIYSEIQRSRSLLELEDDWDDNGAQKISKAVWIAAVKFLVQNSYYLYKHYSKVIAAPEINPLHDGTLDLSWRTDNARMLMQVVSDKYIKFYGDEYNNKNSIKGEALLEGLQEYVAVWMKKLENGK